ncbi:SLATT domain-containing protein [Halobium salinum]|uniref:SLATT domain-containing protein n=1 Tax=Halobium salinum TaxID=1364940 RepID=A0ABD5PFN0_9EURY|nr:SLATT domain-containing protein [Halobium salinum]
MKSQEADFDYEVHERLRSRVANAADSVLWTFKAFYRAADFYRKVDLASDWIVFGISALLTTALIWGSTPRIWLIGLAILTAVLSGFRRMIKPGKKADEYYRAANAYHRLFDDFRDYIELDLADESTGLETMQERYRELAERRQDLNENQPDVTSRWYQKLDDSVYDEIGTTDEAKENLTGDACLSDTETESSTGEDLADSARLGRDKDS